jgi:CDP-diacylglycerol---serine O-phosphatidyltransferase
LRHPERPLKINPRMNLLRHVPNVLTCGNLLCGLLGIISLVNNYPVASAYFVWAACVFDFFDGFTARWLRVTSSIGKELDSLADVVSFGVLPSLTMFQWLNTTADVRWLAYVSVMIAIFSALRLAKFNVDTRQQEVFIGLPTPANAIFITSLAFLPASVFQLVFTPTMLSAITILFSLLLVAPLELFALKFKNYGWADNKIRLTFLIVSVLLVVFFRAGALPLIILFYIILSLVNKVIRSR